jgi:hypothetical protein
MGIVTTAAQACHISDTDTESGTPRLLAVAATSVPVSRISEAAQSEPRVRAAVAHAHRGPEPDQRLARRQTMRPPVARRHHLAVDLFRPNSKRFMFLCQRRIQSRTATATATCFCAQPDIDKRPLGSPDQTPTFEFLLRIRASSMQVQLDFERVPAIASASAHTVHVQLVNAFCI